MRNGLVSCLNEWRDHWAAPLILQPGANRKDSRQVDWAISYLPALRFAQQEPPSQQAEPDEQQEASPFLAALTSDFWADFLSALFDLDFAEQHDPPSQQAAPGSQQSSLLFCVERDSGPLFFAQQEPPSQQAAPAEQQPLLS